MRLFNVKVDDDMATIIANGARRNNISEEKFISEILNRYVFDSHIMDSEQVKKGYEECGEINLELANL